MRGVRTVSFSVASKFSRIQLTDPRSIIGREQLEMGDEGALLSLSISPRLTQYVEFIELAQEASLVSSG